MGQDVLQSIQPNIKFILAMLLAFIISTVSARPQFFPVELMDGSQDDGIEGRHFIRRNPYNYGRPFAGHRPFGGRFGPFAGGNMPNSGPFSSGAGNFGSNGQFFSPNMGGSSATAVGLANTGVGGGSAVGFGSAGNGGGQATGIGIAQTPLGGFSMGVGLAVATPIGSMAQGQAFSLG